MKERPILFSAPMVRAILSGAKTQTRRVVKPQPFWMNLGDGQLAAPLPKCPFGVVGDRLWVREHWGYTGMSTVVSLGPHQAHAIYHADGARRSIAFSDLATLWATVPKQDIRNPPGFDDLDSEQQHAVRDEAVNAWWRKKRSIPSIHMPRWASRLSLTITDVRVQRLQDINDLDAVAEGIKCADGKRYMVDKTDLTRGTWPGGAVGDFAALWDSINGPESWDTNPWVWAITFDRGAK